MKHVLYLGLDCPESTHEITYIHYPVIKTIPYPLETLQTAFQHLSDYTHIILTSKKAVEYFFQNIDDDLSNKTFIAVGKKTGALIKERGFSNILIAEEETSEGIVEILKSLKKAYVFWPHSERSRPVISQALNQLAIPFKECILYTTVSITPSPLPDLHIIDAILFTSPSTVDAFLEIFKKIPRDKEITCIGPITKNHLIRKIS